MALLGRNSRGFGYAGQRTMATPDYKTTSQQDYETFASQDYKSTRLRDNKWGGSRWSFAGATSDYGLQTTDYGGR